ncbi:MAG: AAA family ATPase [Deltaproteobacteria bacterium]|nr:AAA family ATPase [Deltaproteobacteria bacterium]
MRILRLRFLNLNSLKGEWSIDFTHPAYESSGIFAITGPTGSGKTTILDGICLALYGQTPRLGKITLSSNEIMSRQSGECFSEVEFETARGHFRCHWSQHRARKSPDGKLQDPRQELVNATTSEVIESKRTAVSEKIEEVTGMDFDRFTRSIMLAQGGFAAFLEADPDKRAPILEQITGTGIYSLISMKVHERTAYERDTLKLLKAELHGIQTLSPEEEQALRLEQERKQQEALRVDGEVRHLRKILDWTGRIENLTREIETLETALQAFEQNKVQAAPDLKRLERAQRAQTLEGDYINIKHVREDQVKDQKSLEQFRQRLPELQEQCDTAGFANSQSEELLSNVRAEQQHEAQLIKQARELDTTIKEDRKHLLNLQEEAKQIDKQCGDYRLSITKCSHQIEKMAGSLQETKDFLIEHRQDATLSENLAGISQQCKAISDLNTKLRVKQTGLQNKAVLIDEAAKELQKNDAALQIAQESFVASQTRLDTIRIYLEKLLQKRDLSEWRKDTEYLADRQRQLSNLQEAIERIHTASSKRDELKNIRQSLEIKQHKFAGQLEELGRQSILHEKALNRLEENLALINRVRDLEQERERLIDGRPCPLCGSTEHPYAAGNVPQPDTAKLELEQSRTELKAIERRISAIEAEQAGTTKELEQIERNTAEYQAQLKHDEQTRAMLFEQLNLCAEKDLWLDLIRAETDTCEKTLVHNRNIIAEAEEKDREERRAAHEHTRAKDDLVTQTNARQSAIHALEKARSEQLQLQQECTRLESELGTSLNEAKLAIDPYGYTGIAPQQTDTLQAELAERRDAYNRHLKEKDELEKELVRITSEREKLQALLKEAEAGLAGKNRLIEERTAKLKQLRDNRMECYGDKDPDKEEQSFAKMVGQAEDRLKSATRESLRIRADLTDLIKQIERLAASAKTRADKLAELEPAWLERIKAVGLAGEKEFIEACLPKDRLDELIRLADDLKSEETRLQTLRKDKSDALEKEQEKLLSDKPVDDLKEEYDTFTNQLEQLQKLIGAISQRLDQHNRLLERMRTRIKVIDAQKIECSRWERLHELIGSADGKKFRNFAQGLTFEMMIAHANEQLQKMNDRYILLRDNTQPLELNVIDNYQAGEIRSTKNLSGGESFIVSLALALGLSRMASRNVRVDSLFLDEGFGTLDEDALETALETLSSLQHDGKIIGLISHVAALRERIGTQILVEALTGGRSRFSGPGCEKIAAST